MILKEVGPGFLTSKYDTIADIPIVIYVTKFDEISAKVFRDEMEKAENTFQTIIPIVIDSYGGQVYSVLSMVDVIRNSSKRICTIALGKAMSCGSLLFSCGHDGYRFIAPNATLLIHDVSSASQGKIEEIKADANESSRLDNLLFRIYDTNCKKPDGYFKKIVHDKGHADWFLSPEECVQHNLANHISLPKFKAKVSATFDLIR